MAVNGGLTGKVYRRRHPFNGDVLGEGAQVTEVKKVAKFEQFLLNRHKKSEDRDLATGFRGSPAETRMLK